MWCSFGWGVVLTSSGGLWSELAGLDRLGGSCRRRVALVEREERGVHVEQRVLLALGERGVGEDGELDRPGLPGIGVDDAGADVELLGADAQGARQLLEHLGRRLAQAALDLAQVGVAHPDLVGELPQGELRAEALLLEVVPQRAERADDRLAGLAAGLGSRLRRLLRAHLGRGHLVLGHAPIVLTTVSK